MADITEINENGQKLLQMAAFLTHEDCSLYNYVMNTTGTIGTPLTLSQLYEKIVANPADLDWVREDGYWECPLPAKTEVEAEHCFNHFKKRVVEYLEREQKAIAFINEIADYSAPIIDRWEAKDGQ